MHTKPKEDIEVHAPRQVRWPVMLQDWNSLTFLHWPYQPEALQQFLPDGLVIDVFDDAAWLGLTLFHVTDLRPLGLPAMPWLSGFPETNVRTYVRGPGGQRGVWFFTLEAANPLAVLGARLLYGLPYRRAAMSIDTTEDIVEYRSERRDSADTYSRIMIRTGPPLPTSPLAAFLTARFRLYTTIRGKLAFADVEHEPWPLRDAEVLRLDETLIRACGAQGRAVQPLAHFSPGVHVRVGPPKLSR
jgi:uncharacterized protein YqjF (DUF2071 family)